MDTLKNLFMAEGHEMLAEIEKGCMTLEKDHANKNAIASVFRAMHTLKGSAGMFGFTHISDLTHHLETIYESIRDGKAHLTDDILSITLRSLDHLKTLLSDSEMKSPAVKKEQSELLALIHALVSDHAAKEQPAGIQAAVSSNGAYTYYVCFKPDATILKNGSNTLYLIEDLLTLGNGVTIPFFTGLPSLEEIDPQLSYTGFEVVLFTVAEPQAIQDVFMFVESECELIVEKIGDGNLLNDKIKEQLQAHMGGPSPVGYLTIKAIVEATSKKLVVANEITAAKEVHQGTQTSSFVRVPSDRLDDMMNIVSELVTTQARLTLFSNQSGSGELVSISENIEKITRRLRDNAFSMSLVPIESMVVRFQRLVRDLSKELGKEVLFKTEGAETEIDKSVIEKLTDPLLHLLRNSLDHGIETPAEREKKGKPRSGTVLLKAYYSGANVYIEISDDGAGINVEKVKKKAIEKGLISDQIQLNEQEILDLIFLPGFSTAEKVTGVSGRGVGMDVVKRNITEIRGDVTVSTKPDEGTTFRVKLPLTLSIIDGLLVRIGETDFILPLSSVNKCYEVETQTLANAFNQWVTLDGERIPYIFLRDKFTINHGAPELSQVIKIQFEQKFVGLAFDQIIGEYQAVLKPLGRFYLAQDEFSGATILGDGSVALVLDPYRLIKKLIETEDLLKN